MKERFSISIDEDIIKTISSLGNKTGLSKSFICNRFILEGLKRDLRLSTSERYFFAKKIIQDRIELLYNSIGYNLVSNNIKNNIIILYSMPSMSFETEKEYSLMRISVLELIDSILSHDKQLHDDIIDSLKELNQKVIINSDFSEDRYNSETSLLPAGDPDSNNTTNSVTEEVQHD